VEETSIAPRRAAELRNLIGVDHRVGTNAGIPGLDEIRAATPAGTQTVARTTRVVREVVGAFNAGLPLLAFAHFTDDYFRRLAPISDEAFTQFERLGTPDDDEHQTFIELRDVRMLADGRISGIAVTCLLDDEPTQKVVVFTESGDRVLIDAIVEQGQDRQRQTQTTLLHPTALFGADRGSLRRSL
jgi:hypothetical protein